jgi:alpha-D-ribose 1-methylphosphonate 5-phosphate C-P lyase
MIALFAGLIVAGVIVALVALMGIASGWSAGWLDITADIMGERMALDARMINGEDVTDERAALEARVEPDPAFAPNAGVWRWKK